MPQTSEAAPIKYLFRFRDLIAPTISEHRKIIERNGSCWWGWWRRPSEGAREDVWGSLESQASESSPVQVGLLIQAAETSTLRRSPP